MGHWLCKTCHWFASSRCPSKSCYNCCPDKFCPVHSNIRNRCAQTMCNNSPSDSCTSEMCGLCCPIYGDGKCRVHTTSYCWLCKRSEVDSNCSSHACATCCTDRWCSLHGRKVLCNACNKLADVGCDMCAVCCEGEACSVHQGVAIQERVMCSKCNRNATSGCRCCRWCCQNQQCQVHSASYLCKKCDNHATRGCIVKLCEKCCYRKNCDVHSLQCTRCPSLRDKICSLKTCKICCSDRQCPAHKDLQLWCRVCDNRRSSVHCSTQSCKSCCNSTICTYHGEKNILKFTKSYTQTESQNIWKCYGNREHIFKKDYPNILEKCVACNYKTYKFYWRCESCKKSFCQYCTLLC